MEGAPEAVGPTVRTGSLRLHRWSDLAVVGVAVVALASGFGQFGVVAALGNVARSFGHVVHGATIADQAGLSGTQLGVGLAIIRLASLGGLPLAGMADRTGRRTTLLVTCGIGLALTAASAASPSYWWFVVIFALGRPLLSATIAIAQVDAAEQTGSADRAKAVALVAAGYSAGAGATVILHSLTGSALGFRGLFLLALVPLPLLPLLWRSTSEPSRFTVAAAAADRPLPVLGAVSAPYRWRLLVVCGLTFTISVITGPSNSFVFIYAQNVLNVSGVVTATMVVVAGALGLAGLLLGRWLADHVGRRPACVAAVACMAATGVLTYSGSQPGLFGGYTLGVLAAATLAPAAGAMANELFPTSVRASVAGWLVAASVLGAIAGLLAFGAVADLGNRFGVAAAAVFLPALLGLALFLLLPETRGREPEDLWPGVA
ncbi:MAG TPA: MFS transporter [Streptosporangiaceae bacterium]|nr:MFS transporter [Streptosporangiaceae bacterium]